MTSVFTPTKMFHTLSGRQLNFIQSQFEDFIEKHKNSEDLFRKRLTPYMEEFNNQTKQFRRPGLEDRTGRKINFFGDFTYSLSGKREVEEHFGDVYSTNYNLSFAGLAQAHRHRTLDYHISDGWQLGAKLGFFVPALIRNNEDLRIDETKTNLELKPSSGATVTMKGMQTSLVADYRRRHF